VATADKRKESLVAMYKRRLPSRQEKGYPLSQTYVVATHHIPKIREVAR
jgi:hypothetical protein